MGLKVYKKFIKICLINFADSVTLINAVGLQWSDRRPTAHPLYEVSKCGFDSAYLSWKALNCYLWIVHLNQFSSNFWTQNRLVKIANNFVKLFRRSFPNFFSNFFIWKKFNLLLSNTFLSNTYITIYVSPLLYLMYTL